MIGLRDRVLLSNMWLVAMAKKAVCTGGRPFSLGSSACERYVRHQSFARTTSAELVIFEGCKCAAAAAAARSDHSEQATFSSSVSQRRTSRDQGRSTALPSTALPSERIVARTTFPRTTAGSTSVRDIEFCGSGAGCPAISRIFWPTSSCASQSTSAI